MVKIKVYDESFKKIREQNPEILFSDFRQNAGEPARQSVQRPSGTVDSENVTLQCSYCRTEFKDVPQQREHYKLDWHRYNLKQNLAGKPPITEEQFDERNSDISSISGSDSEEESSTCENLRQIVGKIYIKTENRVYSMYRCLLADKRCQIENVADSLAQLTEQWTVIMLGGGHFAGAVFRGSDPFLHKTFHCYTVRAGQGGSQSSRDNKNAGSAPKSAGASLRRYNEHAMVEHVMETLEGWSKDIQRSSIIVIRAPGAYNKNVLFGCKNPVINRNDPRIRTVPFSTRRATFKEMIRVHEELSNVEVYDSIESVPKQAKTEYKRPKLKNPAINRAKSRELVERVDPGMPSTSSEDSQGLSESTETSPESRRDEEPECEIEFQMENLQISFNEVLNPFDDSLTPEQRKKLKKRAKRMTPERRAQKMREREEQKRREVMCDAIINGNFSEYATLACDNYNEVLDSHGNTALHLSAEHGNDNFVKYLLQLGADVCIKNTRQQTPYMVSQDREIRELFKKFAVENPDKFNYNKAQIPLPVDPTLTPEEAAEKKRLQKKAKREREKTKKKEKALEKKEQEERERFANLSDREKRALMAERRIIEQAGCILSRCFLCGADISGKVPFEYAGNRFCKIDCLKMHRIRNPPNSSGA